MSFEVMDSGERTRLANLCRYYSRYLNNNTDFFKLLVENNLTWLLKDHYERSLYSCRRIIAEADDLARSYHAAFIASGLVSITELYVKNEFEQAIEVEQIMYELFSGVLWE